MNAIHYIGNLLGYNDTFIRPIRSFDKSGIEESEEGGNIKDFYQI